MAHTADSPTPGAPQTGTKAILGGIVGFFAAFVTTLLQVWTDADPLQARDLVVALGGGLGFAVVALGVVYYIPNKPK